MKSRELQPAVASPGLHPGTRFEGMAAPAITPDNPDGLMSEDVDGERRFRRHDDRTGKKRMSIERDDEKCLHVWPQNRATGRERIGRRARRSGHHHAIA